MIDNDIQFNKKRDFSDIINVTFGFLRQEFKDLFGTVAIYTIIPLVGLAVVSVFFGQYNWSNYFEGLVNNTPNMTEPNMGLILLLLLLSMLTHIMILGITFEYMHLYHTLGKGNFTRGDVGQAFAKDFFSILGFNIILFIVYIFAFIFFFIPLVYLSVALSFIIMVKIAEKKGFSASWSQCFALVKNNWWFTFGLIIVMSIIIGVISQVFSIPMMIYGGIQGYTAATGSNLETNYGIMTILSLFSTLGGSWLYVIMYVMLGSHYYSLSADNGENSILDRINQIGDRPLEDSV